MFLCHFLYTLLCSRCGFSALNFNRSKVFCSFFVGWQKIFYFFLVYMIYSMYIYTDKTDKK